MLMSDSSRSSPSTSPAPPWDDQELLELWEVIGGDSSSDRDPTDPTANAAASTRRRRRVMTPRQLEMRRKRNREAMRRGRQRQQLEFAAMRATLSGLQRQLEALQFARKTPMQRQQQDLSTAVATCQRERLALLDALRARQATSKTLQEYLTESLSSHPTWGLVPWEHASESRDEFAWIYRVLPLLPELSAANVFELARETYLAVVQFTRTAEQSSVLRRGEDAAASAAGANVLGWIDRRAVRGSDAEFLFSKDFGHESAETLADKTWAVLTNSNQTDTGFQARALHLRVLQRLNANTLLMARNVYFPSEDRYYSAVYVLVRVRTARGYVIGGRAIAPRPEMKERTQQALGSRRSYAQFYYGLSFERTDQTAGTSVQYGGRMSGCSALFARCWAMDVLLAVLRWESSCVGPLYRLAA